MVEEYECTDGSYSVEMSNDGLRITGNICKGRKYKILARDCKLPDDSFSNTRNNDTIIQDLDFGRIFFVQERFLSPRKLCPYCVRLLCCLTST